MKKLTKTRIIFTFLLTLLGTSLRQVQPVVAHSCAFPDFAVLDYDLNNSQNSMHTYSYEPTSQETISYVSELFDRASGHAFVHGFAYGQDGLIYLSKYDGSEYIQAYVGDPSSESFANSAASFGSSEMVSLGEGVAIDKLTGRLYVLSGFQSAIFAIDTTNPAAAPVQIAGAPQSSSRYGQFGIEVGPDGRVYVMTVDGTVEVYDPTLPLGSSYDGVFATGTGSGSYGGRDIAFGPDGHMYTTGVFNNAGRPEIRRYQGPYAAQPGTFMDAMITDDSNGEWPHGLAFHPTTGELFVANFSVVGGIHVYSYTVGVATPSLVLDHVNPANPDGLSKDIQFLECLTTVPNASGPNFIGSSDITDGRVLLFFAAMLMTLATVGFVVWRRVAESEKAAALATGDIKNQT